MSDTTTSPAETTAPPEVTVTPPTLDERIQKKKNEIFAQIDVVAQTYAKDDLGMESNPDEALKQHHVLDAMMTQLRSLYVGKLAR